MYNSIDDWPSMHTKLTQGGNSNVRGNENFS